MTNATNGMKRTIMTMALLLSVGLAAGAQQYKGSSKDSAFVVSVLAEAANTKDIGNVPLFFARKFLGRPYVAHTLEVGDDYRIVVNTRQLDCTTLVENVVALTLCLNENKLSFNDYLAKLTMIRYRQGKMSGYVSRLHYFTDWIEDNTDKGIVTEVGSPNPPFSAAQKVKVNYMSTHPEAYDALRKRPERVDTIRKTERAITGKSYKYIPKSGVRNTKLLRQAIHDGDIIAITSSKAGLDIAHLGFAVWRSDGLHLLNASMLHHKVVEEPMTLRQYLMRHKSHTGIRIVRIRQ